MSGTTIVLERNRGIYNKIKKHLSAQGYKGVITPATLRTEVYTENGKTDYELRLKDNAPKLNTGTTNPSREVRLKEQDAFCITRVRMSMLFEVVAGPVGGERLHHFPSLLPFADEVGGFQNAHADVLYNGSLYLKVGDTTYLEDFLLQKCYVARTQQQTASLKSERLSEDGWIDVTPQFAIRGFDANDLRFKNQSCTATHKVQYTATNKVVLVFELEGFKITGAGANKELNLNFADL